MKSGREQMLAHVAEIKECVHMISRDKSLAMPDPSVVNWLSLSVASFVNAEE